MGKSPKIGKPPRHNSVIRRTFFCKFYPFSLTRPITAVFEFPKLLLITFVQHNLSPRMRNNRPAANSALPILPPRRKGLHPAPAVLTGKGTTVLTGKGSHKYFV